MFFPQWSSCYHVTLLLFSQTAKRPLHLDILRIIPVPYTKSIVLYFEPVFPNLSFMVSVCYKNKLRNVPWFSLLMWHDGFKKLVTLSWFWNIGSLAAPEMLWFLSNFHVDSDPEPKSRFQILLYVFGKVRCTVKKSNISVSNRTRLRFVFY